MTFSNMRSLAAVVAVLATAACSHLTEEQQHLVGTWKNMEPLDATVFTIRANGTWSTHFGEASTSANNGDATNSGRWTFEHRKLCVADASDAEPSCSDIEGFDLPWKRLHLGRKVFARVE